MTARRIALALGALLSLSDPVHSRAGDEVIALAWEEGGQVRRAEGTVVGQNADKVRILIKGERGDGLARIAWASVKEVNGKPAAAHVTALAELLKNRPCPHCRAGRVTILCESCRGQGALYKAWKACDRCAGKGRSSCPRAKCDEGKAPCPGPCLKLGEGRWEERSPLGLCRVYTYRTANGQQGEAMFSKAHCGEIIEVKGGEPKSVGLCKVCGPTSGKGTMPCTTCDATGILGCAACSGSGTLPQGAGERCGKCALGQSVCEPCSGAGHLPATPRTPANTEQGALWDLYRMCVEKLGNPTALPGVRVSLKSGQSVSGRLVHTGDLGLFITPLSRKTEDSALLRLLRTDVEQREDLKRVPPLAGGAPPPAASPVSKEIPKGSAPPSPKPGENLEPDLVKLKDGGTVKGKIVARSASLVMVRTADGKLVKLDPDQIASIEPPPK